MKTTDKQIGGDHYFRLAIQPVEFITKNGLGFLEGNIIKYVTRWKSKNGIEDLRKAAHYLEMLIEQVEGERMDIIARNGNDGLHYTEEKQ